MTSLYGPDHPVVATALNTSAVQLADQGRDQEAEPMLRRVLAVRRRVFGDHHIECEPPTQSACAGVPCWCYACSSHVARPALARMW